MANSFVTIKQLARDVLPRLVENLVFPELAYSDYSDTYTDLGDTIQIRKPVELEGKDFFAGDTVSEQNIVENTVEVKLDRMATVDVALSSFEAALNWSPEKYQRDFVEPAAVALAQKINKAGIETFYQTPNMLGTAGTTPSALTDFSAARKFLNKQKAPMTDRFAVWDTDADAKFTEISGLFHVNESGSTETLRNGEIGQLYGLQNYMTQAIEPFTSSAAGTILTDGAATKGAEKIHLDGISSALEVGDIFTITGDTTKYTVWKAGELDTADQDVWISPALQANAADNVAVTVSSTKTTSNLIFHRNAIAFVTRPLSIPGGVEAYTTSNGKYSLRIVRGYDMSTKKEKLSMDVLYNYAMVNPDLAARYLG